jgi:hypothetical protein
MSVAPGVDRATTMLSALAGTDLAAKQAAEKVATGQERRTSGAKAHHILNYLRPD